MVKKRIDIVIPIYYGNYSEIGNSLNILHKFLVENMKDYSWNIIIGLNGQDKNGILNLCKNLTHKHSHVNLSYTSTPGRGASLSYCWSNSKSDYVSYMDVDLATDLKCFPLMINNLDDSYDLCVGSRYLSNSQRKRSLFRYILSRTYNHFFLKLVLNAKFTDSQCGFKAMNSDVAKKIIPFIKDVNWFWDTEVLYICQKKDYKLKEIPVIWEEKPNSGVKFIKTIRDFVFKSLELRFRRI